MTRPSPTADLLRVARRVVWFKPPQETLRDGVLFLNHVMTWGTIDDIRVTRSHYTESDFREALRCAHPGIFDARSWTYWHLVLNMGRIPRLPVRKLAASASAKG